MKNKLTDFEKEKKQLKFIKTKELLLLIIMTCIAFFGFMIVLVYLCSLIKNI
jgi:predicted MFS family arabinose efflux permease